MSDILIRRALLSVTDKTGLVELGRELAARNVELISTGGSAKALAGAGLPVKEISSVTGFPEILDGRVKTLHPAVHAGILARRDKPEHMQTLVERGLAPLDLIVCNLYAFSAAAARAGSTVEQVIEEIDIGGPTLIRAAAKNYSGVAVLTDPGQYREFLAELKRGQGSIGLPLRQRLAVEAFARIAEYDQAIAGWFAGQQTKEIFPPKLFLNWSRRASLRYGENPHQAAAFYVDPSPPRTCVGNAQVLGGKELSFNNLLDLDSALTLVRALPAPAAVVIKHNNPCGAAVAKTLAAAMQGAHDGDPQSAFGGIVGLNRELDAATATYLTEPGRFFEAIIAPGFSSEALQILRTRPKWKESVRLLSTGPLEGRAAGFDLRRIEGGLLVDWRKVEMVTRRPATEAELADLAIAWTVARQVKSNAIVLVKDQVVVGVGAGQMSRVDSVHIAVRKAGPRSQGSVMASDAFFPFPDNVESAAAAGVTAIAQPGGSVKDKESVAACDRHGLAMVFTGVRHFKH
jgi:phosphoribosylaminoimidazolecarboxamide formyltransferase/IMP cyclohydrolase